ncbi:MAG TPA: protein ndvB, partial [Longimicrobiales bacterium]|nr:protein ndvB [Longimicrobiales bacterium]
GLGLPPLPWTNCIANEELGCIVSERGSCFTWAANSRENRLTPWPNDPVRDPHGEALYLRDDESGAFWSPLPGPAPAPADYEVRHGFGCSRFRHESHGLLQETTFFVPRALPVRIARMRVTNRTATPRRLSLYVLAQLVLGGLPQETRGAVVTHADPDTGALFAHNPRRGEFSGRVAFAATVAGTAVACSSTTDRAAFLGPQGDVSAPAAVRDGSPLDGALGARPDPCFAHRCTFSVPAGATFECALLLGEAASTAQAQACLASLATLDAVAAELDGVRAYWHDLVGRVRIATPAPALDLMVNGWLAYQNLSCRMWARSAFYQSGGAFGFRDQLQDSSALLWLDPARTRAQILLHAAHQFVEGDVLHWWHPPLSKGIRTRFADDLLWLPCITNEYVRATGDGAILDEPVRYLSARALEPGEDEAFVVPDEPGETGTLYEHCCRAIDRSLPVGAHGLPLIGTGDWNDGMNRVGREGRGESVWLGFFLFDILRRFVGHCEARGDAPRAARYREQLDALGTALNDGGWDGAWYRRAYYDDGTPLGAAANDECRIDTIAQAWAVLSGAAPPERAAQALDAMEQHLVAEHEGIIRLLTPAFDRTPHDPGYIKGYLPGVRENGGQYTHGALWAVRALAQAGRTERAAPLLEMLSPVSHTRTPAQVARYMAEPYVIAADVYGVAPHIGRGGWTWYTGSAGWMYRVALESILGLELRGDTLAVRPCIPESWPGFEVTLRRPEATYQVTVARGGHATGGTMDGAALDVRDGAVLVPLAGGGGTRSVAIRLGDGSRRPDGEGQGQGEG